MKIRSSSKRVLAVVIPAMIAFGAVGLMAPSASAAELSAPPTYQLTVNGETTTIAEGQTATFALKTIGAPVAPAIGQISPDAVYTNNAGTLTVTGSNGEFHYSIAMSIPATGFAGSFKTTDLTSGISGGYAPVLGFSGTVATSNFRGHRYSGALTGEADFLGIPVASVVPNLTIFTNN
jgi:hypothetical protein